MSGLFFTYFNDQSFVDSYHIIGFESSFSLHMIRSNGIKIFVLPDTPNNNDSSLERVADPIDARHQAARKIGWSADLFDEKHVKRFFSYHCMPRVIEKLPIAGSHMLCSLLSSRLLMNMNVLLRVWNAETGFFQC